MIVAVGNMESYDVSDRRSDHREDGWRQSQEPVEAGMIEQDDGERGWWVWVG